MNRRKSPAPRRPKGPARGGLQSEYKTIDQNLPHVDPLFEDDDEPICILTVQLDGKSTQKISVYEEDDPRVIVERFGKQYKLSANAK